MTEVTELFPYQVEGALWLSFQTVALLADEMGLGKSAQAITAADLVATANHEPSRILVLCPASARINWTREFDKFSTFPREFHTQLTKKDEIPPKHSVISSYDLASEIPSNEHFDTLILDESHFLKGLDTKRTRTVFGRNGLCRRAKRVWALSGTPMPNHPGELWVMLHSFGQMPISYPQFVERFCTYYESPHGRKITGAKHEAIPILKEAMKPIMLRRKKEEVLRDLPPINFSHMVVEPGKVDLDTLSSFVQYVFPIDRTKELLDQLKKEQNAVETIIEHMGLSPFHENESTMKALEAVANSVSTLRRYTGLQKTEPAGDMVEEELMLGAYNKIVIFAIHRDVIYGLMERLKRFKPVTLYGGMTDEKKQRNVDRFQNDKNCSIFIGNIQAAGVAITLTAANQVLFVEQSWTPADNAQAAMRCHRIGQTSPVFVRVMGLVNSIDDKVSQVLKTKMKLTTRMFDDEEELVLPDYAGRSRSRFQKLPFVE